MEKIKNILQCNLSFRGSVYSLKQEDMVKVEKMYQQWKSKTEEGAITQEKIWYTALNHTD